jgi:hypothetical protein
MCTHSNPVEFAVAKCPFLAELARKHGTDYASRIAINPTRPAHTLERRPVLEETVDLERTFALFHGPLGVVPLVALAGVEAQTIEKPACRSAQPLPFASLSLSGVRHHIGHRLLAASGVHVVMLFVYVGMLAPCKS